jgi:ABC-type branched-subunit amino acid transport system substrate-binding protein
MLSRRAFIAGLSGAAISSASGAAQAQDRPGVTATTIRLGNTNPYSGPASAYSVIAKTIAVYFEKRNEKGGVNGRSIEFISYDDAYSPPKTVEQTRRLVEGDDVLLVFASLGTATNAAVLEYLNQRGVPQLFVATGASTFGDPAAHPWTMAWQPVYSTEAAIYARHILESRPEGRIGVLYQNDDYGRDYLEGLRTGLGDQADAMIAAALPYETSDATVDSQVINLKASGADIFLNVATPKFAAQAIRKSAEIGWQPLHILNSVSQSVGAVLEPAGLDASKGIVSAAYLKDAGDPQWDGDADMEAWRKFMDEHYPDGDRNSNLTVYGYAVAQALEHVLKTAGDDLSRDNVMKVAAGMEGVRVPMLLPGITMSTSATDYYPLQQMQLMRFTGERWALFGDVIGR